MNAIQFIKENGVEKSREVVQLAPDGATHLSDDACHYVNANFKPLPAHIKEQLPKLIVLDDLKRLVESVDMLKRFGGIELSKEWILEYSSFPYRVELEQAIADYESIGGEHV